MKHDIKKKYYCENNHCSSLFYPLFVKFYFFIEKKNFRTKNFIFFRQK